MTLARAWTRTTNLESSALIVRPPCLLQHSQYSLFLLRRGEEAVLFSDFLSILPYPKSENLMAQLTDTKPSPTRSQPLNVPLPSSVKSFKWNEEFNFPGFYFYAKWCMSQGISWGHEQKQHFWLHAIWVMNVCEESGEHEKSVRGTWGIAKSNSSFFSAV